MDKKATDWLYPVDGGQKGVSVVVGVWSEWPLIDLQHKDKFQHIDSHTNTKIS